MAALFFSSSSNRYCCTRHAISFALTVLVVLSNFFLNGDLHELVPTKLFLAEEEQSSSSSSSSSSSTTLLQPNHQQQTTSAITTTTTTTGINHAQRRHATIKVIDNEDDPARQVVISPRMNDTETTASTTNEHEVLQAHEAHHQVKQQGDTQGIIQNETTTSTVAREPVAEKQRQQQQQQQQQQPKQQQQQRDDHGGNDKKKRNNNNPVFVLHVGIHKTGTTYLQNSLCTDSSLALLLKDNFVVLGTGYHPRCFRHTSKSFFTLNPGIEVTTTSYPNHYEVENIAQQAKLNPNFVKTVTRVRRSGRNALLIFEDFAGYTPAQIRSLANFLKPNWKVHVIVAYRPLYSWLLSLQSEFLTKHERNAWPGQPGSYGKTWQGSERPSHLHAAFDLDDDERPFTSRMFRAIQRHGKHPAEIVREKYLPHFGDKDVSIMPYHVLPPTEASKVWNKNGDPLLGCLFCRTLMHPVPLKNNPDGKMGRFFWAPRTCNAVKAGKIGQDGVNANPAGGVDYHLLADHAYERGLVPKDSNRHHVIRAVRDYHRALLKRKDKGSGELVQTCTSPEMLEQLKQLSWQVELSLFDNYNKTVMSPRTWALLDAWDALADITHEKALKRKMQAVHHYGFRDDVSENKYCRVDARAVLGDPENDKKNNSSSSTTAWIRFFRESWDNFANTSMTTNTITTKTTRTRISKKKQENNK